MFTLNTRVSFEASHQLKGMPEGHKCGRLHGHSYSVEVTVLAETLQQPVGLIIDTGIIRDGIRSKFDHRHVNDVLEEEFDEVVNPTAENMAFALSVFVQHLLDEHCDEYIGARVGRIAVRETENSYAEYIPKGVNDGPSQASGRSTYAEGGPPNKIR